MTAKYPQLKDCRLCHRCGYRGFVPSGDYAWVCYDDGACRRRIAKRVSQ